MNTSLRKFGFIGATLLLALSSLGQVPIFDRPHVTQPLLAGGTNNVAATATNTYNLEIPTIQYDQVGFTVAARASAAATGTFLLTFSRSYDGSNWATTTNDTIRVTLNGTNEVVHIANFDCPLDAKWRLNTVGSTNAVFITNLLVTPNFKAPASWTRRQ